MSFKRIGISVCVIVFLGILGLLAWKYYKENYYVESIEEEPGLSIEEDSFHETIYRIIADTAFIHYDRDCQGVKSKDAILAFVKYGCQVLSNQTADVNSNENLEFNSFGLSNTQNWMYVDTSTMNCYRTRKDSTYFAYVDSKSLVTEEEFMRYYEPLFGQEYQAIYSSIPVEFKRAILKFIRDNEYIDRYHLSPSFDRAYYVNTYGNFTRTEKPVTNECMAVVFDEINGQSSRLVIFGRVQGTRDSYIAYNEYFDFPATIEMFDAQHKINKNNTELETAGVDGVFVKFDLETTKALLFDEDLKRFVWYKQGAVGREEVTSEE